MKRWIGLLGAAVLATGCGAGDFMTDQGFGATPGGIKDMQFARDLVTQGQVPPPDAILVEAMFSEHDLPLAGAPCETTLCLRGAVGVAPDLQGQSSAWAQIGMSSNIDPATFERPPLAIVATVDVSGSMGWGDASSTPGEIARDLLVKISKELEPTDSFAMVTYGDSVSTPIEWTSGDSPSIPAKIAALETDGSTNMEAGLKRAFELAHQMEGTGRQVRVMLFTDEQPNVGATSASEFETMVKEASTGGVGLTVLGLGYGLGIDVMKGMSHLRGGNAFSLTNRDQVPGFMEENWPWFNIPIAYDLSVKAAPTAGLVIGQTYGFPQPAAGEPAMLDVSSVFLSKQRGALLLKLAPDQGHAIASGDGVTLDLSYADPDGGKHETTLAPSFDGAPLSEAGVAMPQPGISRAVSLALFTSAMHDAVEAYQTNHTDAVTLFAPALDRLNADAVAANDEDLAKEAEFWIKLLDLMQNNAPQGDLYGQDY